MYLQLNRSNSKQTNITTFSKRVQTTLERGKAPSREAGLCLNSKAGMNNWLLPDRKSPKLRKVPLNHSNYR